MELENLNNLIKSLKDCGLTAITINVDSQESAEFFMDFQNLIAFTYVSNSEIQTSGDESIQNYKIDNFVFTFIIS